MRTAKCVPMASPGGILGILAAVTALGLCFAAPGAAADLREELKQFPYRIVFESYQDDNFELMMVNADGTGVVNLTKTPKVNELYPHVSPDGTKVSFVVDGEEGGTKVRSVWTMNLDGSGRTLVQSNAREPCWSPAGDALVYLKGESEKFTLTDFATRGIYHFDLATRTHKQHPNTKIEHLYNICCTPDGKWYVATVHAGMGYSHAILAIEAEGSKVFNLKIPGCRPDVSPDGKRVAWGADDYTLCVGDLDFSGPEPKVVNRRDVVQSPHPKPRPKAAKGEKPAEKATEKTVKTDPPMELYHVDWSPDGKYLAFSRGPKAKRLGPAPEMVGVVADGWNICVADASAENRWVEITTDGKANKEPDWVPVAKKR
jgi:dipeptidyl aminopeptidase/acylaminoacyl peptidase